jgi:flagellar motor switch protein FliN/FliY
MLGGNGATDRPMNEESVDALKEAFNQILGVSASSFREKFEGKFSFEQVEVHSLEAEMDLGLLLDDGKTTMIDIELAIEGANQVVMHCCFPDTTVDAMSDIAGGKEAAMPAAAKAAPGIDNNIMQPPPLGDLTVPSEPATAPKAETKEEVIPIQGANVDLIMDIELPIVIRLGSTEMTLKDIMKMGPGAIIELNKGVDEPVELLVNNQPIARGEVVVVEGNFAFRVTEIESRRSRIESLA